MARSIVGEDHEIRKVAKGWAGLFESAARPHLEIGRGKVACCSSACQRNATARSRRCAICSIKVGLSVLEACGPLLAERAGEAASVTKGTAEPVGLPASQGAVPRGLMREADTAVGPRERKPSRR